MPKKFRSDGGLIRFQPTEIGRIKLEELSNREIQWIAAEHANSCLTIGDDAALKLYRRVSPGNASRNRDESLPYNAGIQ